MNLRLWFFLCCLGPWFATSVHAQKFDKITSLKLYYWRAFHGEIKQEVRIDLQGRVELFTTVNTPGSNYDEPPMVKPITLQDLASVLALFNDTDARQSFMATAHVLQPDGSLLSITATQNSFGMSFASQDAFTSQTPAQQAALGRVALALFRLAGITIPKDELY